jgi:hypothetical protein
MNRIGALSPSESVEPVPKRGRWILLGALLLPLVYVPTLTTRFDFIDDGNLVYPAQSLPLYERAQVIWQKIAANYEDLGPFRPTLWIHWEVAADLLGRSELGWRITRLLWCGLAAAMLLWLFAELRIGPLPALFIGALAMWNPYRNEIWTSLTLAEGVAMPYALLSLIAMRRAGRSQYPVLWEVLGVVAVLIALGCKNTFAALVPAQVFLRITPDGMPLREGLRRYGGRAAILSLTLLAPIAHLIYFRLHWHSGQYLVQGPTWLQFRRIVSGLGGAVSLDFIGAGLAVATVACAAHSRGSLSRPGMIAWAQAIVARHRATLGAGVLLLLGGVVMYLPMDGVSGRYSMPAVWGLDLALAVFLSVLAALPSGRWTRASWVTLTVGLLCVMTASFGKQQKFAARTSLLWQALEWVERQVPANTSVAWICGDSLTGRLNVEEGIHFQWHLAARGRSDVRISLCDERGQPLLRRELPAPDKEPALAIWGTSGCPEGWGEEQRIAVAYWLGQRRYECSLGRRRENGGRTSRLDNFQARFVSYHIISPPPTPLVIRN